MIRSRDPQLSAAVRQAPLALRPWVLVTLAFALVLTLADLAAAAGLTADQQRQVATLLKLSHTAEQAKDPVKAFLHLREALRLEQLWTNNTLGEGTPTSQAMERFSAALVRRNDDSLMRILHSRVVPLADKLGLIRLLEEEIILNFPGVRSDALLQGYDE